MRRVTNNDPAQVCKTEPVENYFGNFWKTEIRP